MQFVSCIKILSKGLPWRVAKISVRDEMSKTKRSKIFQNNTREVNKLFDDPLLKMVQTFSITIALAPPPPLQIAAAPIFPLFCFSTFINVTIILAPLQPNG